MSLGVPYSHPPHRMSRSSKTNRTNKIRPKKINKNSKVERRHRKETLPSHPRTSRTESKTLRSNREVVARRANKILSSPSKRAEVKRPRENPKGKKWVLKAKKKKTQRIRMGLSPAL